MNPTDANPYRRPWWRDEGEDKDSTLPVESPGDPSSDDTNDAMDLFSEIFRSLAADAAAIRQITDIAELAGVVVPSGGAARFEPANYDNEQIQKLVELDRRISGIEKKVVVLRQIINEENSALTKFETTLRDEAEEQAALIETLMAALELKQRTEEEQEEEEQQQQQQHPRAGRHEATGFHYEAGDIDSRYGESLHHHTNGNSREWFNRDRSDHNINSTRLSPPRRIANRRRVLQPRMGGLEQPSSSPHPLSFNRRTRNDTLPDDDSSREDRPTFVPVTEEELRSQLRLGSHLSRYVINEVLEEIQQMVWNKMAVEKHHPVAGARDNSGGVSSLQRRFEYLRQRHQQERNPGAALATRSHEGHHWVSEQELRENCAFFRYGESTARSTLQLLCSLKRLKQVPGKHTEVTYLCLF